MLDKREPEEDQEGEHDGGDETVGPHDGLGIGLLANVNDSSRH